MTHLTETFTGTVTLDRVQAVIDELNQTLGLPLTPWTRRPSGVSEANAGNIHLFVSGPPRRTGYRIEQVIAGSLFNQVLGAMAFLDLDGIFSVACGMLAVAKMTKAMPAVKEVA